MAVILVLFLVASAILFFGMIGDKDANNRKNYMCAFCTLVLAIVFIVYKFM